MKNKQQTSDHLISLIEVGFFELTDAKIELLRLVLNKAFEAGQAFEIDNPPGEPDLPASSVLNSIQG